MCKGNYDGAYEPEINLSVYGVSGFLLEILWVLWDFLMNCFCYSSYLRMRSDCL